MIAEKGMVYERRGSAMLKIINQPLPAKAKKYCQIISEGTDASASIVNNIDG